ncbi:MAG: hypothetical protein V1745_04950 [Patescibacteria group bacterium]
MKEDIMDPYDCVGWQKLLKAIAFGSEPEDPALATGARTHALRCPDCWESFLESSKDAVRAGRAPVPPMLGRAVVTRKDTSGSN